MLRATRTVRLAALPALLALALLLAVACGGDDASTPESHPDVPADAPRIDQDGLKFSPNSLTVAPGETVYFTNSESALHTVNIEDENVSGDMRRGAVFVHTFDEPGEFKITCEYHPQMRSTVTVE